MTDYIEKIKINNEERAINGIKMVSITYSDLVTLRETNGLTPGMQYRITDYICTVANNSEARAVSHPFDIIVTADTTNTLNENARACMRNHDNPYETDYYRDAFSALPNARYDLRSPKVFIDRVGGKPGKYVFIKDNIDHWVSEDGAYEFYGDSMEQFGIDMQDPEGYEGNVEIYVNVANLSSWKLKYCLDNDTAKYAWADPVNGKGVIYWMKDEFGNEAPYDFKQIQFKRYKITDIDDVNTGDMLDDRTYCSLSVNGRVSVDRNVSNWFYTFSFVTQDENDYLVIKDYSVFQYVYRGEEAYYVQCYDNIIGNSHYPSEQNTDLQMILTNNVFINYWCDDGWAYSCNNNVIDSGYGNTFLNGATFNSIYGISDCNLFGTECHYNKLTGSSRNLIGCFCQNNVLNFASEVAFGIECLCNQVSYNSSGIVFEGDCSHNVIESDCHGIYLSESCYYNTFKSYNYNIDFIKSNNGQARFHTVLSCTNRPATNKLTINPDVNLNFVKFVGRNSSGVLTTACPLG